MFLSLLMDFVAPMIYAIKIQTINVVFPRLSNAFFCLLNIYFLIIIRIGPKEKFSLSKDIMILTKQSIRGT